MSDCPTKETIAAEVARCVTLIDFNHPVWKAVEDYLAWYRLQLSVHSLAVADPTQRATLLGRGALATELITLAQQFRKENPDGR